MPNFTDQRASSRGLPIYHPVPTAVGDCTANCTARSLVTEDGSVERLQDNSPTIADSEFLKIMELLYTLFVH